MEIFLSYCPLHPLEAPRAPRTAGLTLHGALYILFYALFGNPAEVQLARARAHAGISTGCNEDKAQETNRVAIRAPVKLLVLARNRITPS